jgi:esterase/lipase superfamily enzyme
MTEEIQKFKCLSFIYEVTNVLYQVLNVCTVCVNLLDIWEFFKHGIINSPISFYTPTIYVWIWVCPYRLSVSVTIPLSRSSAIITMTGLSNVKLRNNRFLHVTLRNVDAYSSEFNRVVTPYNTNVAFYIP